MWSRPPVVAKFQVPQFAASGLHVRFLQVKEPQLLYETIKWVRYNTRAGVCEYRI